MKKKLRIKIQDNIYQPEMLLPFKLTKQNRHLYEIINDVILKKSRKEDFIVVNEKGIITAIEGSNKHNRQIGENVYD